MGQNFDKFHATGPRGKLLPIPTGFAPIRPPDEMANKDSLNTKLPHIDFIVQIE